MSDLWMEIWTRPGHASFGRVVDDVPAINWGFGDGLNEVGAGNMRLPDSFDAFDDILYIDHATPVNCVSSLCRVYSALDPANPLFEWIPNTLIPTAAKTDHDVEVSGRGIKGILTYARVEAFDWSGANDWETLDPDWIYGGLNNIQNGGLEDDPLGILNQGFEDGTREPWWPGAVEGYSANLDIVTSPVDTGTYAARCDPLILEGGMSTRFRVVPEKTYTVTARIRGAGGVNYQLGCSGPAQIQATSPATVSTAFGGGSYASGHVSEAQLAFAGSGAYATQTLIFTTAPGQTYTQLSIREAAPFNGAFFYVDVVNVTGYGIGTDPWEPTDSTAVSVFQASTTQANSGSWSLQTTAETDNGVFQRVRVEPGVTYTAYVSIGFASAASTWALDVRDATGTLLGQDSATIATNAWSDLVVTFRTPTFLPGPDGEITIGAINYSGVTRSAFVDDLIFHRGLPAATLGKILGDLYDDATADHAPGRVVWEDDASGLPYLTLDFNDTVDSAGAAWAHSALEVKLWMRMTYLQVMDQFASSRGYEWRIIPDDPENGSWLWQVFNPGTLGTDRTAAATPAIQGGSQDVRRSLRRFIPVGTDMMVEGDDNSTGRARDGDLVLALGRIESSRLDRELPSIVSVSAAADEDAGAVLANGVTYTYTMVDPQDEPLSTYQLGDTLVIHDPPEVEDEARFTDIEVVVATQGTEWECTFVPPAPVVGS